MDWFDEPDDDEIDDDFYGEDDDGYGNPIYSDDDDDGYPEEVDQHHSLYKAPNGHLAYIIVTLARYSGQDWGECHTSESVYNIRTLKDEYFTHAIKQGKSMKPGETADFYPWKYDDEEDEEDDSPTDSTWVGGLPF